MWPFLILFLGLLFRGLVWTGLRRLLAISLIVTGLIAGFSGLGIVAIVVGVLIYRSQNVVYIDA